MTDFPFESIEAITFQSRPKPISASLRPIYRITLIVLVLRLNCRAGTSSLLKLHFFNWIIKSADLRDHVENLARNQSVFSLGIIHLDPMVNLALKYAHAEGLISITNNSKYALTPKGQGFADSVLADSEELLWEDWSFLKRIKTKISDVKLARDLGVK
jgi:hypothetical protein